MDAADCGNMCGSDRAERQGRIEQRPRDLSLPTGVSVQYSLSELLRLILIQIEIQILILILILLGGSVQL